MRIMSFLILIVTLLTSIPAFALDAQEKAKILEAVESLQARVKEFEAQYKELEKSGALYEVPEDSHPSQGPKWEQLLKEANREVENTYGAIFRGYEMNKEAVLKDPKAKQMITDFQAILERMRKNLGWFSPGEYGAEGISELGNLDDVVRFSRRAYCLRRSGATPEEVKEVMDSAQRPFDRMIEKAREKPEGVYGEITANLEKHPQFLAAKERLEYFQAEIAKLDAADSKK